MKNVLFVFVIMALSSSAQASDTGFTQFLDRIFASEASTESYLNMRNLPSGEGHVKLVLHFEAPEIPEMLSEVFEEDASLRVQYGEGIRELHFVAIDREAWAIHQEDRAVIGMAPEDVFEMDVEDYRSLLVEALRREGLVSEETYRTGRLGEPMDITLKY